MMEPSKVARKTIRQSEVMMRRKRHPEGDHSGVDSVASGVSDGGGEV